MITRVVLNNNIVLENINEIQEVVQNNGNYILNGLTLNITKGESNLLPTLAEVEDIFNEPNVTSNIKVYKKDIIETTDEGLNIYGDEYLSLDTSKYTGIQSIYNDVNNDRISIQLTSDPTSIADEKYNELVAENERLEQTILELTMLLGGVM